MKISWKKIPYTQGTDIDKESDYTVFDPKLTDEKKENLEKSLTRLSVSSYHDYLFASMNIVTFLLLCISIFRVIYSFSSLMQFILNLVIVMTVGKRFFKISTFKSNEDGFYIFDSKGNEVVIDKLNESAWSKASITTIQIFYGYLFALSFFFTQVTSGTCIG